MSATNTTTHYNLPSFLATDKPAWLVDWNGAMASIDAGIYQAQQTADTNTSDISGVQGSVTTLAGTVESQGLTISTLSQSLTTAIGNINTINSLIGNGTPTTTDQTIIGAINEINARTGEAEGISYDNTDSGLTATNVQSAIDENADEINNLNSSVNNIGDRTILAQSSSTTWANTPVSLDAYREIEVTYTNDAGKLYLAQSISKDLFITRDSANKCFSPEIYTTERNAGEFYYSNGMLYYRKSLGSFNVAISGIK